MASEDFDGVERPSTYLVTTQDGGVTIHPTGGEMSYLQAASEAMRLAGWGGRERDAAPASEGQRFASGERIITVQRIALGGWPADCGGGVLLLVDDAGTETAISFSGAREAMRQGRWVHA